MTTIARDTVQCFVCGTSSEQHELSSTNQYEPSDLDGRPGEMARSTMPMWVQKCPHCGYCAPSLSRGHDTARDTVHGAAYQAQLNAPGAPPLLNHFLCMALLCDAAGWVMAAAQQRLRAAWVADDAGLGELARQYRSAAADAVLAQPKALRARGKEDGDWKGSEWVSLVDVLRRAGRFEEALREVDTALQQGVSCIVREVLRFERSAIERSDTQRYRHDEALPGSKLRAEPRKDDPLLDYLLHHYSALVTPLERKAAYTGTLRTPEGERWATDDLQVLTLLARGKPAFTSALQQRLLSEHPGKVLINRCPKCGGVARTPKAQQCRFCGHDWHPKN